MTQLSTLLELRTKIKSKKPDFIRQDYHRRKRLGRKLKWKKPKGIHSKIRHHFKGRRKMPSPGYKSPAETSGIHSSGLSIVRVFSATDLKGINKETDGIIVARTAGMKNKLEILRKAKETGIKVLNLNTDESIKKIEEFVASKSKKKIDIKKEEIKKEVKKTEQDRTEELTDEQKKQAEKKEKDKILTKKV